MCCSAACCLMDGRLKSFHLSSDASARWPVGGRPEGARYTGCLFEVFVSVEFVRYDPCSIVTQTSERRGLLSQDSKEPIHRFLPPAMARCLACKTPDRAESVRFGRALGRTTRTPLCEAATHAERLKGGSRLGAELGRARLAPRLLARPERGVERRGRVAVGEWPVHSGARVKRRRSQERPPRGRRERP